MMKYYLRLPKILCSTLYNINPVLTGVRHAPSYYKNRTIFLQTHSHVVETFFIDVLGVS